MVLVLTVRQVAVVTRLQPDSVSVITRYFVPDEAEEAGCRGQREADDVAVRAVNLADRREVLVLDGVRPRLVEWLARRDVGVQVLVAIVTHGDLSGTHDRGVNALCPYRDGSVDRVGAPAQRLQHPHGLLARTGFAERDSIQLDDGISNEHSLVGPRAARARQLQQGNTPSVLPRSFAWRVRLIRPHRTHLKRHPETRQELAPARRCRREHETRGVLLLISRLEHGASIPEGTRSYARPELTRTRPAVSQVWSS